MKRPLHFLFWSRINAGNIRESLGAPEYSYYFLLKEFRPAFERLGQVSVLDDPAQADARHDEAVARGEDCVLIAFTAPQNLPQPARCPVIPLFAWEFERIPDEAWGGNPRNDWRVALGGCERAITLSAHAVDAVRATMGAEYPILAVPVPVWERMEPAREFARSQPEPAGALLVEGAVLDTRDYVLRDDAMVCLQPLASFACAVWDGSEQQLDFRLHSDGAGALIGFYLPEPWGAWSRNTEVSVALPWLLCGDFELEIDARAYGSNQGRTLVLELGDQARIARIGGGSDTIRLHFALDRPERLLRIGNIDVRQPIAGAEERTLGIGLERLRVRRCGTLEDVPVLRLDFRSGSPDAPLLHGFWKPDAWGAWSRTVAPWILLPRPFAGRVEMDIALCGCGPNAAREVTVHFGAASVVLVPHAGLQSQRLVFELNEPAQVIVFTGMQPVRPDGAADERELGIGVGGMELRATHSPAAGSGVAPARVRHPIELTGTVYTSVLNPRDNRKNWTLMIEAFCRAFAARDDVTLLLKMTHHQQLGYLFDLHYLLQRLPPFRARVLVVHGFLDAEDYDRLIARTDYYVNLSSAEGLCIPLMEFMCCGKPAIAPCHTSLRDYLDETNSITVAAGPEPCVWPHDTRNLLRTLQYRVSWESAVEAFANSLQRLGDEPDSVLRMGEAAMQRMRAYCSLEAVTERLRVFLERSNAVAVAGDDENGCSGESHPGAGT